LPLTEIRFAPGPSMVTLLLIDNSLATVMVPCSRLAKSMVSPLLAAASSARSEPDPLSRRFVTVKTLGKLLSSSASKRGTTERRGRVGETHPTSLRRDRAGEPEVNCRSHDAINMMHTFLEENRSAGKSSSPERADPAPGLAASL